MASESPKSDTQPAPSGASTTEWIEQVEKHLAEQREFLQAKLLGELCDFGFEEVFCAFQRASAEYSAWVLRHPMERQGFMKLEIALRMMKERVK